MTAPTPHRRKSQPGTAPRRPRWPRQPGQPQPRIPANAEEKVTQEDEKGAKVASEFWLAGQVVGRAYWNPDATPAMAVGIRQGVEFGHRLEFHEDGTLYAEPFVRGQLHGWAKQWTGRGQLLLASPFRRGTGTDYWCDSRGRLHEEHPLVAGKPSGCERWGHPDQKTVYEETEWLDGDWHGARRHWTNGTLDRGNPKFFIRGEAVSKSKYLAAARRDSTLPEYRREHDSPARILPKRFVELRKRLHRAQTASREVR